MVIYSSLNDRVKSSVIIVLGPYLCCTFTAKMGIRFHCILIYQVHIHDLLPVTVVYIYTGARDNYERHSISMSSLLPRAIESSVRMHTEHCIITIKLT